LFIPLHIYSSYSFLSSGFTIDRLISTCKQQQFQSVGLTDRHVLFGFPEFQQLTKRYQINPIFGMDILHEGFLWTVFAKNEVGYRWLVHTSSSLQHETKSVDFASLGEDGIVVLSPHLSDAFDIQDAQLSRRLATITSGLKHVFIGLPMVDQVPKETIQLYRDFAKKYTYRLVAFPHILYAKPQDALVVEILGAISRGETLSIKEKTGTASMPTPEKIAASYSEDECAQTVWIASQCHVEFESKRGQLIRFDPSLKGEDLLREKAIEGLQNRPIDFSNLTYLERLDEELTIIEQLGFSDYFLIVADFVHYAKREHIPVGPGRGSAPGSLVAYALGITDIDPIPHHLLFERFLNPSRKTMPDIDIDIADVDREKIVDYLRKKYGQERVANIITFQTIQAKQAVRDIGRVYGFSQNSVDLISKTLGDGKVDLKTAYKQSKALRILFETDSECSEIIKLAHKIEGFVRQSGMHPAGIILNDEPLHESIPTLFNGQFFVSQYEMGALENQGYLKIDILGLRNLTFIQQTLRMLALEDISLDLSTISYDDHAVFETLQKGLTMGIFQLESPGMNRAIQTIQPSSFNDLVSLLALYRPGPMDNIQSYALRKKGGEPITSLDPQLNPILAPTYGIIVYQEQIMQIAQKMAGFSLSKADDFRRAIAKKDNESMKNLKEAFLRGAVSQGYKEDHALSVYNHIFKFADYGFNKSHSVAYAVISYHMLYLKTYYPHAFFATLLNQVSLGHDEKLSQYLEEIRALKIPIHSPSLLTPTSRFTLKKGTLLAPLTLIKGVARDMAKLIEKEASRKPFDDFFDFVTRMYNHKITAQTVLALIDAGACDGFHVSRASLRATIPNAMKNAAVASTFLDESLGLLPTDALPKMPYVEAEDVALENIERELDVLDHFLSQSVLARFTPPADFPALQSIQAVIATTSTQTLLATGGIIKQRRIIQTKSGQTMAFMTLYDESGSLEAIVFPRLYETVSHILERGRIVMVTGRKDQEKPNTLLLDQLKEAQP
jgi:DNA polymerase-3 subunit alpha